MCEMFGRVTCVNALYRFVVQQSVLRNITALFTSKSNIDRAATQAESDDVSNAKTYEDIPGPKPMPILGNSWRFLPGLGELSGYEDVNVHKYLYKKFGKILKITGIPGRRDIVILFDPDDIEKVYRNEGPTPILVATKSVKHYRMVTRKNIFQDVGGLLVSQGEEWQKFRTKVNPTMMQPTATELYVGPIDAVSNDFIERIRDLRDDKQEMPADFINEINKWALESIVFIAMDTRLGCLEKNLKSDSEPQKLIHAVNIVFDRSGKLETGLPIWKYVSTPAWRDYVNSSDYILEISMKYINEAMKRMNSFSENADRELTVLEKLLARDSDPKTGIVMALDMISVGVDSTSFSLAIALYFLAKNPEKQQILFEEIKKFLPNKEQPITQEILNELKYLKACIRESMRISSATFGTNRTLIKDLQLSGYLVPKGTKILMPLRFISNEEKYFPQANKFLPERWLRYEPYSNKKMHSFASLPFGFGPRMCVGKRFAELEIDTLVTKVIRNFRIAYNYDDMKFKPNIFYIPVSPLKFKMEDREM